MVISVIIPAHNEEKYIEKCLFSLEKQVEKPDEIIVVDNNCRDKTIAIAKKFRVKIVKEKRQGIAFARNKGFDCAKGDIIVRCDADTIVPPDWIKKIKTNFQKHKIDALTGSVIFYDLPLKTPIFANVYMDIMKTALKGNNTLNGFNMAIKKNIWKKVRKKVCLDSNKVHEDVDLAIQIGKAGGVIAVDKNLVVKSSGRRIVKKPYSFFAEYPIKLVKTLKYS